MEMTVKDSHYISSSGTFKPPKYKLYHCMFLFWFLYIYHHRLVKHFNILIAVHYLYIRKDINLLFLSLSQSLTLNVLTYSLILGNIKTLIVL